MSSQSRLALFQICWNDGLVTGLNPGFEPFDWRSNPDPAAREAAVFRHVFRERLYEPYDACGFLSAKFPLKACVDGPALRSWIARNPGYDAYIVNPWPQQVYAYFNVWQRGDTMHGRGFTERAAEVMAFAGVPYDPSRCGRHGHDLYVLSSAFVGSPKLWKRFGRIVDQVLALRDKAMPRALRQFLFEEIDDYYGFGLGEPLFVGRVPFILERMLPTLLEFDRDLRVLAYPADAERTRTCCFHPIDRAIVDTFGPQVDAWDAAGRTDAEVRDHFRRASAIDGAACRAHLARCGARWAPLPAPVRAAAE